MSGARPVGLPPAIGAAGESPVDRARLTAFYDARAAAIEAAGAPPPPPALEEGLPEDLLDELAGWARGGVLATQRFALSTGCGSGAVAAALVKAGAPTIGIDLSLGMLKRCNRLLRQPPAAMFVRADAARTPFHDRSFGAIVDVSTFRHYPDVRAVVTEWARLVAPKGVIVIADVVEKDQDTRSFVSLLEHIMRPGTISLCYKPHELAQLLESVGFTVEKATYARLKKPLARLESDVCRPAGTDPAALRRALAQASKEVRELYEVSQEGMVWRYTALLARRR